MYGMYGFVVLRVDGWVGAREGGSKGIERLMEREEKRLMEVQRLGIEIRYREEIDGEIDGERRGLKPGRDEKSRSRTTRAFLEAWRGRRGEHDIQNERMKGRVCEGGVGDVDTFIVAMVRHV